MFSKLALFVSAASAAGDATWDYHKNGADWADVVIENN